MKWIHGSDQYLMHSFDYANTLFSNLSLCVYSDTGMKKVKRYESEVNYFHPRSSRGLEFKFQLDCEEEITLSVNSQQSSQRHAVFENRDLAIVVQFVFCLLLTRSNPGDVFKQ